MATEDYKLSKNVGKRYTAADVPGNVELPKYLHRCGICHYVVYMDELPGGFRCPNCDANELEFERWNLDQGLEFDD